MSCSEEKGTSNALDGDMVDKGTPDNRKKSLGDQRAATRGKRSLNNSQSSESSESQSLLSQTQEETSKRKLSLSPTKRKLSLSPTLTRKGDKSLRTSRIPPGGRRPHQDVKK